MRIGVLLVCAACALALCGCEENDSSSAVTEDKPVKQTTAVQPQPVEVREYAFPEFVREENTGDMLANVINVGFDPADAVSFLGVSPFKDYNCDRCFGGRYYTYYEDDHVGILDSSGKVLLEPGKYDSAEMVSDDLVVLGYPEKSGKPDDLFWLHDGGGEIVSREEAHRVLVEQITEGDSTTPQYSLSVRGKVGEALYDSIERVEPEMIVTKGSFDCIYKASIGSRCYFLVLDEYCNITVCEAPYALVSFKAAGEYGQCYILDGDDHTELMKMIHSFGSETISVKPSKDEALDYIRIESGLFAGEKRTLTMSPDGFCLTETVSENGTVNRFFALYPKDTFVDLINWVAEVLPKEYSSREYSGKKQR